ncbi:MAG: DNA-3-methyladenine glycosylase I [Pseudorhodobacter sp.]
MTDDTGRCPWCGTDPLYVAYHDTEWGVPERDPRALWEMLILEGFQAGLSWFTILKRRENFRTAFRGFDPAEIAGWGEPDVLRLLGDAGIIRHRGKIEGTIRAARSFQEIEAREGFSNWIWSHVDGRPVQTGLASMADAQAQTPGSVILSRNLRQAGFGYCGPVIAYAFMQAAGLVNDHLTRCPRHAEVAAMGA